MPIELHIINADGSRRMLAAPAGRTLMRVATDAGIEGIVAECGGTLSCATCHVIFDPEGLARVGPPGTDEAAMLELTASPREPGSRLACQVPFTEALHGLALRLPASQY